MVRRYKPNFVETEACKFVPFDRAAVIASELEDGFSQTWAERVADRMERKHNERELKRVKAAQENVQNIKTYGKKLADRVWFTTCRG